MRHATWWIMVWACGCSLGGGPPRYDYFVLTPTRSVAEPRARHVAARETGERPTVGLSQVTIPGYLERETIVTRTDDHRVVYSTKDRWAEPLEHALERTLRHDLAAALAPSGITVPPHAGAPTYDLQVDIVRFERRGADRVELWARWTLRADAELVHAGETRRHVPLSGAGNAAAAAALSTAIAVLAGDIAEQVQRAEAGPRAQPPSERAAR